MLPELSHDSLLVFALWLTAMLVLWNLYRYADFLSRKKMVATIAAISFLFFAIAWGLDYKDKRTTQKYGNRIAIYAMPISDGDSPVQLQSESIAMAEIAREFIAIDSSNGYRAYPLDWLYVSLNRDSVAHPEYLRRVANRIGYPYFVVGAIQKKDSSSLCRFKVFQAQKDTPLLASEIVYPNGNVEKGARLLAAKICSALGGQPSENITLIAVQPRYYEMRLANLHGDRGKARQIALALIEEDSTNTNAWKFLAESDFRASELLDLSKNDRVRKVARLSQKLARLSDLDSTDATLARLAGAGYYWQEKFNEAAFYTLRAYRQSAFEDSRIYNQLAKLHYSRYRPLGFLNEVEIYNKALQCNPGDLDAVLELAAVRIQLKQTVQAQQLLEKYHAIFPDNPRLLRSLGEIYVARGLPKKIFATYEKILQHNPNDADAYYNLGIYYYNSEDVHTAVKFFKKAIKVGNHLNSRLYLAKIAEKQKKISEAITYLRERIRLKTGDEDAYAEEARRHLYELMLVLGKIDSTGKVIE
jgi:tetratricopeptide (TPR) repeat protein